MVSATQLSTYIYCTRKLFIQDVLMVRPAPKLELIKGKVWHEVHDSINKGEEQIVLSIDTTDYQKIYSVYKRVYLKMLRNAILARSAELRAFSMSLIELFREYSGHFDEQAKSRSLRLSLFIKSTGLYGKDLWNALSPKMLSEQYLRSVRLNLSGVIDMIEVHGNTQYVPVELKTGRAPQSGMWEGHRVQLGAYMLLLEDQGKPAKEAILRYKGEDGASENRLLVMNEFLRDEILGLVLSTSGVLKADEPPGYVDNKNKCRSCQFREICYDSGKMQELVSAHHDRTGH